MLRRLTFNLTWSKQSVFAQIIPPTSDMGLWSYLGVNDLCFSRCRCKQTCEFSSLFTYMKSLVIAWKTPGRIQTVFGGVIQSYSSKTTGLNRVKWQVTVWYRYSQVHKKICPLFLQREPIRNLNEFLLKSHQNRISKPYKSLLV